MLAEDRGNFFGQSQQRIVIGAGALQNVEPCDVVLLQQRLAPLLKGLARRERSAEREPPGEKVAAQGHVFLPVAVNLRIGALEHDLRVGKAGAHEVGLRAHDGLSALPVAVCDLIVVRHALVHLLELALEFAERAVKHHQHRRRAERPAPAFLDADGGARHLRARAAVQAAHRGDVVVHQKAHDEVALAEKVAALTLRPVGVFGDRGEQQLLELEHLWDLPPGEHAAHQNEERKRVLLERFDRAVGDEVEHLLRAKRREQDARVALDDAQRRVVVFGKTVEFERMQILPMRFVPLAISIMVNCLPPRLHRVERALGAVLHHVVEAERHAVRQALDKGVLLGQRL